MRINLLRNLNECIDLSLCVTCDVWFLGTTATWQPMEQNEMEGGRGSVTSSS